MTLIETQLAMKFAFVKEPIARRWSLGLNAWLKGPGLAHEMKIALTENALNAPFASAKANVSPENIKMFDDSLEMWRVAQAEALDAYDSYVKISGGRT